MTELEATIRDLVTDALTEEEAADFDNQDDLLSVLNSLQILRMILELEAKFGIKIDNSELTAENLGSVQNVSAMVARKVE